MKNYRTLMTLLFSLGVIFQGCDSDVKCRNDKGAPVDWYILYKLPQNLDDGDGLSYMYMDQNTKGWQLSEERINSESGAVGRTLKPLLDYYDRKTEGFGYLLYNDQPPTKSVSASFGHSKGVVMLDRKTGVWLSHSTPRFPTYQSKNFWPHSGNENGQTFICVTYAYDQFKEIGLQLKYIHAYSYDSDVPKTFHNELRCVAHQQGCYPKKEPWYRVRNLTSLSGSRFTSFAKYTRFYDDLYSGLLVFHLNQPLYVKSWGKMKTPLNSNCSASIPYHVYDVKSINLMGEKVHDTADHSKWCVTPRGGWTCIADTNREMSQMKRGGGAICTDDAAVRKAFVSLKLEYQQCDIPGDVKNREL